MNKEKLKISLIIFFGFFTIVFLPVYAEPVLTDDEYSIEEYISGLEMPTTMTFIENDILILQKNDGKILLVRDDKLEENPILDVEVSKIGELGLLGILNVNSTVYVYYTESIEDGGKQIANRIYKYNWDGNTLQDSILVNEFPVSPGAQHVGGVMAVDSNGTICTIVGDMKFPDRGLYGPTHNSLVNPLTDSGGIILVGHEESILSPSTSSNPYDHFYAIGIRNGFGLAVDPITDHLWDTENGPEVFDEINMVLPKFNSGWGQIQGPSTKKQLDEISVMNHLGFHYDDPKFSWNQPVAPTALTFIESNKFEKYKNHLFVGDCVNGNLYKFRLNSERNGFEFNEPSLKDKVFNSGDVLNNLIFGMSFGCITDLKFGPDGLLYVTSLTEGKIFRIIPSNLEIDKTELNNLTSVDFKPFQDLSNVALFAKNLTRVSLAFANLTNADLRLVDLTYSNLSNAILTGADLSNADLSGADLSNADLSQTNLKQTIFRKVNFEGARIIGSDATAAYFGFSNLNNTILTDTVLLKANFSHAKMMNLELASMNFYSADFKSAQLSDIDLHESDLRNVNFNSALLNNVNLSDTNLRFTDFTKAELINSDLSNADWRNSILVEVKLVSSNLDGTLLDDSDTSLENIQINDDSSFTLIPPLLAGLAITLITATLLFRRYRKHKAGETLRE